MSAPNNNNRGQAGSSQPPHVVQTILESFTRCFAPIDECSSPSSNHSMDLGGSCYSSGITGAASATGGGGGCDGRAAVSRSISSSNDSKNSKSRNNNNNNNNMKAPRPRSSTTTNNEGRRKSSSNSSTRPIPTAEELNERSMKRKLEIFRGSGQSSSRVPTTTTTTTGSSSNNLVQQQDNNRGKSPQSHQTTTTTTSDDDDDDEEILRLTQNSARNNTFGLVFGGCGLGHYLPSHDNNEDVSSPNNNNHHRHGNSSSPLFTNCGRMGFGTGGQWSPPGFLCFATPVRSNSGGGGGDGDDGDNLAHVSDDKLTADEFLSRHGGGGGGGGISYGNGMNGSNNNSSTSAPPPPPKQVSPEHNTTSSQSQSPKNDGRNSAMSNQGGSSVYTEITDAQTIESTLYFDQKYSHVIQTRPPMPLFQENIVTSCGDESYYDCGTNTTTTTGSTGGGGGGGGSSFLFGEGLFSNSKVGNEISTIIYNTKKKRTSILYSQQM